MTRTSKELRQDLQDEQDSFAFPEERQKASSLFEGTGDIRTRHIGRQMDMRASDTKNGSIISAEGGLPFLPFIRKGRKKQMYPKNPVNPV